MGKNAYFCRVKNVAMLKLIFSPYYDGNCYAGNPEKKQCVLGTKHVGPLGLLDELELRAGLSRGETSPMMRAIAYCNAIQKVLDSKPSSKPFYQQSFENDPLGVAQQLLRWRDALCMAGWDKDTELPNTLSADGKKRLEDLQAVEEHFHSIGVGERWHQLLNADLDAMLPKDLEIEVDMKMELLPPVIRKVLEKTNRAKESEAVANVGCKTLSDYAGKFTLCQFPEQNDAYQWAALQTEFTPDVCVNEDNFTFNQVLKSVGKPLVDASVEGGAAELSQLLKLGVALFRAPVNYDKLMSYLSIFKHPINWEIRHQLRRHLRQVGGFGDWVHESESVTEIADTVKDYPVFWGMWEKCKNGRVEVEKVKDFCKKLSDWTESALKDAAAERLLSPMTGTQVYAQMLLLQEQIKLLLAFLGGRGGDISNDELDKATATICQGSSVNTDFARLGSRDTLNDLKGLAVGEKTVMWMDCVRKPRPLYEYAFLNPADIKELQKAGLLIPDAALEMRASDFAEKLAVGRAGKIIALMPKRKDGGRTEENLLITELLETSSSGITIRTPVLPSGVAVTTTPADTQKVEHKVDPALFDNIDKQAPVSDKQAHDSDPLKFTPKPVGYQRDYESFSSLSELINQPFDYVLDYIYSMKDEDSGSLSTVEGNVAHWVISQMVEESKDDKGVVDTAKFLGLCNNAIELENRTDNAIYDVGAALLQPENEMECTIFKRIFIGKSVPVLVKIIENNKLEVVGSEVEFTSVLKGSSGTNAFNFNAKIDCVLKRKKEETNECEYLIFDFKWTNSPKKREEELKECKELQLALYQKILEANGLCPVVMRGYYLLKQAQLLTVYPKLNPKDAIVVVPRKTSPEIFEQAVNSYRERIQNLKEGYIEEGEEMKGPEFEPTQFVKLYFPNPDKYYLNNDLCAKSKKDGMTAKTKRTSYGKNVVLKGKIQ